MSAPTPRDPAPLCECGSEKSDPCHSLDPALLNTHTYDPADRTPVPPHLSDAERALWEKATKVATTTPGPWSADTRESWDMVVWGPPNPADATKDESGEEDHDGSPLLLNVGGSGLVRVGDVCGSEADAEFIAAANPAVLRALLTALSSEREAGERYKAALDDIERRGYEWASEDFDKPESPRFAALASIASEALNPQTEADEIDCRSYCK